MNVFFDTSALIKRYIDEPGTSLIENIFRESDSIFVSAISEIEAHSTFKRLLVEKAVSPSDYLVLKEEFGMDFRHFNVIPMDDPVIENAKKMIENHRLKTLDSIQLGSALSLIDEIDAFICSDEKLIRAAKKEGFETVNPL